MIHLVGCNLWFAEYACTGPGATHGGRVDWTTVSADPAPAEVSRQTVLGDWQPLPNTK